jgi:uroporphyrinogen decarboxylase
MKDKLNSYERMMMALEGKQPDRCAVSPLVRDFCLTQVGFKVSEAMTSPEKNVYAQYACAKKFGWDGVRDFGAVHSESEAMGSKLKIPEDETPSVVDFVLKDYDKDLHRLKIPNPWKDGRLPMILEGTKRLAELCKGEIPIISYIQAPFRHASMLRGPNDLMKDLYKRPDKVKELLEITTVSQIDYGIACVHAGADIIFISDPTSSGDAVSPKTFKEFAFPYISRVVSAVKKTGVKMIMHICGDTTDRLEAMANTGVDCLSLDTKVDFGWARKVLKNKVCLMGNIDPNETFLFKGPEEMASECRDVFKQAGSGGGFILSSGCGVPASAPAKNLHAMVRTAKNMNWESR